MTEFTRHKSLSSSFYHLIINENDLTRIAAIISSLSDRFGEHLEIKIVSADGEETITTSDMNFFTSQYMPLQITSVSIAYSHYKSPVSCRVNLDSRPNSRATISVDGTDRETVSGIYHELEREIRSKEIFSANLNKLFNNIIFKIISALLLIILVGIATYSIFDIPLNFAAANISGFKGSQLHKWLSFIGWICIFLFAMSSPVLITSYIEHAFPGVKYSGRLSDRSSARRSRLIWIITAIILPIILNILSNMIWKGLK